jgi:hypothetical protein
VGCGIGSPKLTNAESHSQTEGGPGLPVLLHNRVGAFTRGTCLSAAASPLSLLLAAALCSPVCRFPARDVPRGWGVEWGGWGVGVGLGGGPCPPLPPVWRLPGLTRASSATESSPRGGRLFYYRPLVQHRARTACMGCLVLELSAPRAQLTTEQLSATEWP